MKNKISVIVPVYNVEKYIKKCIESIVNQTYTNLEIILVNDGSTDKSGDICEFYASRDNRIKVIHKANGGLSDARNAGLDIVTGDYISFIDSDDYIHKKFYEILLNLIILNDADISQCEFVKVYEQDERIENNNHNNFLENGNISIFNNIEALNNLYNNIIPGVVWNKLYKTELFKDERFPKGKIHEDDFTTYKLLYKSKKIVMTSQPLHYYLQRPDSIMGKKFNVKRLDSLEAFSMQVSFYNKNNLFELRIKAIIKLENNIRSLMRGVLNSDINQKKEIFNYLLDRYRGYFDYFKDLDYGNLKKIIIYLFKYSPSFVVKLLFKLLDIRDNTSKWVK